MNNENLDQPNPNRIVPSVASDGAASYRIMTDKEIREKIAELLETIDCISCDATGLTPCKDCSVIKDNVDQILAPTPKVLDIEKIKREMAEEIFKEIAEHEVNKVTGDIYITVWSFNELKSRYGG